MAVDGGTGAAEVKLPKDELATVRQMAARTASNPSADPLTGAELGMRSNGSDGVTPSMPL